MKALLILIFVLSSAISKASSLADELLSLDVSKNSCRILFVTSKPHPSILTWGQNKLKEFKLLKALNSLNLFFEYRDKSDVILRYPMVQDLKFLDGPFIQLSALRLNELPRGSIVWNLYGESAIIGVDSLQLTNSFDKESKNELTIWGLRPAKYEFESEWQSDQKLLASDLENSEYKEFKYPKIKVNNQKEKIALFILKRLGNKNKNHNFKYTNNQNLKTALESDIQILLKKQNEFEFKSNTEMNEHYLFIQNLFNTLGLQNEFKQKFSDPTSLSKYRFSIVDIYISLRLSILLTRP